MKTILVVDDEYDMACTLRALLEGEGYRVATCGDGREALRLARAEAPDLILMDVMLPIQSGLDVLRSLGRTPGLDGIPVILMSSAPPTARRDDYGWRALLHKPFGLDALMKAVAQALGEPAPAPEGPRA